MNVTLTPAILRIRLDQAFELVGASRPQLRDGEAAQDFQRRTIRTLQENCRAVPLSGIATDKVPDGALLSFADQLCTQVVGHVTKPSGPLRMVRTVDAENGRRMTRFFGDPGACWDQFRGRISLMRFRPGAGRGAEAPGAARPVSVTLSDGSVVPAR